MSAATSLLGPASPDAGLYAEVTRLARQTPDLLDDMIVLYSAVGLALFAAVMVAAWWLARGAGDATMARALAAPVVVVAVYGVNTMLKGAVHEIRPCRAIPGSFTLEKCPSAGDWSFPSNHAAIAFAAAAALWAVNRWLGAAGTVAAVLMAASRVWVGVHYPHDVAVGAIVGLALAAPLTVAVGKASPIVRRARGGRLRFLLSARPPTAGASQGRSSLEHT
ncbi:phosphatase PAP2 family protein [Actinomadura syzygii]|uniref:Phosphatase PAP2 family protein n=1 Tax=Actinomadura syzygii TaxID=1427538 RepID=A0A5D0UFE0_9ACTN|nr:phosphatase PAP2 family protein [Actinomadura syzygii]TYC15849.1 phosphatase PAP2 family protein [Actinomadura syzygii]